MVNTSKKLVLKEYPLYLEGISYVKIIIALLNSLKCLKTLDLMYEKSGDAEEKYNKRSGMFN